MNVKNDIIVFLEKSGFDDFTKIRYIYLYVCDLFSYDIRFSYARDDIKQKEK